MLIIELHYADKYCELFGPFETAKQAVEFGETRKELPDVLDYYVRVVNLVKEKA